MPAIERRKKTKTNTQDNKNVNVTNDAIKFILHLSYVMKANGKKREREKKTLGQETSNFLPLK